MRFRGRAILWGASAALLLTCLAFTFVRLPLPIAISFVEKYHEYFVEDDPRHKWLSSQPWYEQILVQGLALKIFRDWITQQTLTADKSTGYLKRTPGQVISDLAFSTQHTVLSQRYVQNEELALSSATRLSLSVRLLLGFGYCSSVNKILSLQLSEVFKKSTLWATRNPDTGISHHTLALVTIEGNRVFADAWSAVPAFTIEAKPGALLDIPHFHQVPARVPKEYGQLSRELVGAITNTGQLLKLLDQNLSAEPALARSVLISSTGGLLYMDAYRGGYALDSSTSNFLKFGRISLNVLNRGKETNQIIHEHIHQPDVLYLIARVFYLYGDYSTARELFLAIAKTGCETSLHCRLARKFLEEGLTN